MESFKPTDARAAPLSTDECMKAVDELTGKLIYPKINRKFVDPARPGDHRFALFSFVKAKGATADNDGFFGVAKIRGSFYTAEEAAIRAEELIRDVDSTNSIYTCLMGAPFPLVTKGNAKTLSEVNLRDKTEKAISDNVRMKRLEEQKEIDEIKERSNALMNNDTDEVADEQPAEKYIEQRVKLAHLRYAMHEHTTKLAECKELEIKVRDVLRQEAGKHPDYEEGFLARFNHGRRKAHIPEETDLTGFLKYFADPIDPVDDDISYIS
jgi:hypothetical protein